MMRSIQKTVHHTFMNLMRLSTACDAGIFAGLFRLCADGGSRCSNSKITLMSLSHPTEKYQVSGMPHVPQIGTVTISI